MKKKYYLCRLFLVIVSVLVFSFLMNGCTSSKHLFRKKLKYPDWPGLDNQIEKYDKMIDILNDLDGYESHTSIYRMNDVDPNDIKWEFEIAFKKNISEKLILELLKWKGCEIYKSVKGGGTYSYSSYYYIKIPNNENIRDYYEFYTSLMDRGKIQNNPFFSKPCISYIYLNPLLPYSQEHYRPIYSDRIKIYFSRNMKDDEIELFSNKYNISFKEKCYGSYIFSIPKKNNIIKLFAKLLDDKNVTDVFLMGWDDIIIDNVIEET
ncbi:hypothetical protein KAU33_13020 [Candidatus Dependentiae bacterium]|nr:hypothetical protein [Candidatus Dependentiae bacterium]